MKTGTTYLQQLMSENREALAAAGYLFPGRRWTDQSRAARDVMKRQQATSDENSPWRAMAAAMVAHPGEASVFSMEFLSFADAERAARILEPLEGAEVHAVLTVRDTTKVLPAQWQTSCRNRGTIPWPRFVNGVQHALRPDASSKSKSARVFQRTQGIVRMLGVWEAAVGARRLHVVTVPPRGSDPRLLWDRFAQVIGVDPQVCSREPVSSNASMGHASTEMLRQLNLELADLIQRDYERVVRGPLRPVLGARTSQEEPIRLNRRGARLAAQWNRRVREAIADSGARFVGDQSDLPIQPPDPSLPEALPTPDPEAILAAAVAARDGLLDLEANLAARVAERAPDRSPDGSSESSDGPADEPPHGGPGDSATRHPTPTHDANAILEAAALVRRCVDLSHRAARRDRVS